MQAYFFRRWYSGTAVSSGSILTGTRPQCIGVIDVAIDHSFPAMRKGVPIITVHTREYCPELRGRALSRGGLQPGQVSASLLRPALVCLSHFFAITRRIEEKCNGVLS